MPPPEMPSPSSLYQLRGTPLPPKKIFTSGGTEKGDSREELSQPSNLVLHVLLWLKFFGICFLGMTQFPLFYPKYLLGPTLAEKPK